MMMKTIAICYLAAMGLMLVELSALTLQAIS